MFCTSNPKIIPADTSPLPAVVKVGGAFSLMMSELLGGAITAGEPLKTTTAFGCFDAAKRATTCNRIIIKLFPTKRRM
jgi:hypothetical protein